MIEWDGRPPSGAGVPSVHILRPKVGRVECAALWSGYDWFHTWGDFGPVHAAKFYEYVGPLLTPAEVEAKVEEVRRFAVEALDEAARRYPNQAEAQLAFVRGALSWGKLTAEDLAWANTAIRQHEQETSHD